MSLSIIDQSSITQDDLNTIANCDLNDELIALKLVSFGESKIITLPKNEVTCKELLLKIFGFGSLANLQIHLSEIVSHLNRYNWRQAADLDCESVHFKAYVKVCMLANKALLSKGDATLFRNVSSGSINKKIEYTIHQGFGSDTTRIVDLTLPWNLNLEVQHIKAFLKNQFETNFIQITDEQDVALNRNIVLAKEQLQNVTIRISTFMPPGTRRMPYISVPRFFIKNAS